MEDNNFYARLEKKIYPFFSHAKGHIYYFDFNHNDVYMVEGEDIAEYPLRPGLAGYMWLCLYEKGYFTKADNLQDLLPPPSERLTLAQASPVETKESKK